MEIDRAQAIDFIAHLLTSTPLSKQTELVDNVAYLHEGDDYFEELRFILEDFQDYDPIEILKRYFAWQQES